MNYIIFYAMLATLGTWFVTALGAGIVILFKNPDRKVMNLMLGFAAGVMIAASFWSLLQPAIEKAEEYLKSPAWLTVSVGFLCGAVFMWVSDKAVTYTQKKFLSEPYSDKIKRVILLVLSITLHNIPEGLAVGVAFGTLGVDGYSLEALMGAITISIGIGLQNFPEGAAVSLPLRREGMSRGKAFLLGQASGMVEPIAGVLGAALVIYMRTILPFTLSFAAGAMVLVAVHELIPQCQEERETSPYFSTMGIVAGFTAMMLLDVALG